MSIRTNIQEVLTRLEITPVNSGACWGIWIPEPAGGEMASVDPTDGSEIARVKMAGPDDYEQVIRNAAAAFLDWRHLPAPKRGQIVREIGDELRRNKDDLGALVSLETGKILAEGKGEVQEMIDICDFATGLSRQLHGLVIASERPGHRMFEQWHPLGIVGIVTAFNFPVAVWAWNSALAAACGDATLWKPSSQTPLTAIATIKIAERVCRANHVNPAIRGQFQMQLVCASIQPVKAKINPLQIRLGRSGNFISIQLGHQPASHKPDPDPVIARIFHRKRDFKLCAPVIGPHPLSGKEFAQKIDYRLFCGRWQFNRIGNR